jgi:hypothetical protein
MHHHRNAMLGPAGRRRIVEAVEGGPCRPRPSIAGSGGRARQAPAIAQRGPASTAARSRAPTCGKREAVLLLMLLGAELQGKSAALLTSTHA